MSREALKLALEALEQLDGIDTETECVTIDVGNVMDAIEEALAQPEQETNKNGSPCSEFWDWLPKAYNFEGNGNFTKYNMEVAFLAGKQASQRTWVGLTDEEVNNFVQAVWPREATPADYIRAIEAKLKEKNT